MLNNLTKCISHVKVPVLSKTEDGLQEYLGTGYVYPIYKIVEFNKEIYKQRRLIYI